MIEYNYYEPECNEKVIGRCEICGCNIFASMDHYYINREYCCEECKDAYMDQFFEEGIDEI